jgi:hypothetical protein
VIHLDRRPQAALVFENVAGANFVTVDFGHVFEP